MRSLFISAIFFALIFAGTATPFVFGLGYIWVDLFRPQDVSYFLIRSLPVSAIMAAGTLGFYFLMDRKCPPKPGLTLILLVLFAVWITMTTTWAVAPNTAWRKWDWAFKAVLFGAMIPFLFRSRIQIEAFMLVYLFSISGTVMSFGAKTLASGGGYGLSLGLTSANSGLSESSTLAMVSISAIPMLLFLQKHSRIIPEFRFRKLCFLGLIVIFLMAAVGSFARTGLVTAFVLAALYWWRNKNKMRNLMICLLTVAMVGVVSSDQWIDRMSTIKTFDADTSALGRIAAWKWTLEFVSANPQGGGFNSFVINRYTVMDANGEMLEIKGKAFHSSYFEVLGEHGYLGLAIFMLIIVTTFTNMRKARRLSKGLSCEEWISDLANSMFVSVCVYLAGALFVGVAFQPMFYYYVALSVCMMNHAQRTLDAARKNPSLPRQEAVAVKAGDEEIEADARPNQTAGGGWRKARRK